MILCQEIKVKNVVILITNHKIIKANKYLIIFQIYLTVYFHNINNTIGLVCKLLLYRIIL